MQENKLPPVSRQTEVSQNLYRDEKTIAVFLLLRCKDSKAGYTRQTFLKEKI